MSEKVSFKVLSNSAHDLELLGKIVYMFDEMGNNIKSIKLDREEETLEITYREEVKRK